MENVLFPITNMKAPKKMIPKGKTAAKANAAKQVATFKKATSKAMRPKAK